MTDDKNYQEKVEKLKDLIGVELDLCDPLKTPKICANASSPESRKDLVDTLLAMCLEGNISVEDAIDSYEHAFNPNMAD